MSGKKLVKQHSPFHTFVLYEVEHCSIIIARMRSLSTQVRIPTSSCHTLVSLWRGACPQLRNNIPDTISAMNAPNGVRRGLLIVKWELSPQCVIVCLCT
jgi:hypothetical protein